MVAKRQTNKPMRLDMLTRSQQQATVIAELLPAKDSGPAGPMLQEQEGVLIDARWHGRHRKPSEWRWNAPMHRLLCHDCFSSTGYPMRPPNPCPVCNEDAWYERLPVPGGLWVCGCCHPAIPAKALERLGV